MLALIVLYIACFGLSVGPVSWVILAEIYPTAVRGTSLWIGYVFSLARPVMRSARTFLLLDAKESWFVRVFNHAFSLFTSTPRFASLSSSWSGALFRRPKDSL